MLYGKMSYGRGPEDDENSQIPPGLAGIRSRPVSGEFPVGSSLAYGEHMSNSSLHKRVHPYPTSKPGNLGPENDDAYDPDMAMLDEVRHQLSRKVSIVSSKLNPYRMVIVARLVILAFFLRYRIMNPVHDVIRLWLISVICEIWFAFSWILDQFPK
ncbi:hypothetical protein F3Y22_tig00111238pilonHSYRG00450 [Hibiscus syriacus]|uniref:Uncharacterized protein n=1 Tax=Hibiscus syriacus TaxID=106335 RepID=A0A6A2YTC6_HIBSY|nr:hypothetical protein F3Y22_tig00111238pilonHSYRG00450 [Hibiscus syriacus]